MQTIGKNAQSVYINKTKWKAVKFSADLRLLLKSDLLSQYFSMYMEVHWMSKHTPINLNNSEKAINELLDISKMLSSLGVSYESQRPVIDLAQEIYARDMLPSLLRQQESNDQDL